MEDDIPASPPSRRREAERVGRAALVVAAVVIGILAIWRLAEVLLLGFAAVLFAIILRSLAEPIANRTPISIRWSLVLAGLLITALTVAFFWLLGSQIQAQASNVAQQLPEVLSSFGQRLGIENLAETIFRRAEDFSQRTSFVSRIVGFTSGLLSAAASVIVVVAAGIYLASRPDPYRRGMILLLPRRLRPEGERAVMNVGHALRLWLLGQLVSMTLVGILITVGLYAIGMQSALALGFLAGVAEFVPILGPLASAVPAVLLAIPEGGTKILLVIGLYVVVQQIESYLILPLVQHRAVDLPPVLTLFALLALGILFGPLGILLATPLTVALYVAVKQLYLRDVLHEDTKIPGTH